MRFTLFHCLLKSGGFIKTELVINFRRKNFGFSAVLICSDTMSCFLSFTANDKIVLFAIYIIMFFYFIVLCRVVRIWSTCYTYKFIAGFLLKRTYIMRKKFLLPVNEYNNEKQLMIGSYRGQLNTMCNIERHLRRQKSREQNVTCLKHTRF